MAVAVVKRARSEREKARARERSREYRDAHPEIVKARKRAYYEKNIERLKAKGRAYHAANKIEKCKVARRRALMLLGTNPEEREKVLVEQGGCCAICKQPFRDSRNTHTDHDHETGAFRALLCTRCNNGLGVVERDGGQWLWGACAYLVRHGHPGFTWVYEPEDVMTSKEAARFRATGSVRKTA